MTQTAPQPLTLTPGRATEDATKNYADTRWRENPKLSPDSWRQIENLTVAKIGIGTYRMGNNPLHRGALKKALLSGINLIDTASNYMDGDAEVLIGRTLAELFTQQKLRREEVVLVAKAGYIQGRDLTALAQTPPPGVVKMGAGLWHSIHPTFLERQARQSCMRLGVEALDIFLLHNPEYMLLAAHQQHQPQDAAQTAFYEALTEAFTWLETQCKDGMLTCYGVSSNTFGAAKTRYDHADLARVMLSAEAAAQAAWGRKKRPMLRVIELPLNLVELDPLFAENTQAYRLGDDAPEAVSTLELATRRHLSVLANRPLNAFGPGGTPLRLADSHTPPATDYASATAALAAAEAAVTVWPEGLPQLADQAPGIASQLEGSIHTDQVLATMLDPIAGRIATALKNRGADAAGWQKAYMAWREALRHTATTQDMAATQTLRDTLTPNLPQTWQTAPLQDMALNVVTSLPGITCALCGLREERYVADAIRVLEQPGFADISRVLTPS